MGTYTNGVADFRRHVEALVLAEFPSAFGGQCEVGHHLLRRLNHPSQVNDPHIIVPVTASQHAEFHASPPTIELLELSKDKEGVVIGAVFDYHGKEYGWLNKKWVEAWYDQPPSK